jgi:hypothetical protein
MEKAFSRMTLMKVNRSNRDSVPGRTIALGIPALSSYSIPLIAGCFVLVLLFSIDWGIIVVMAGLVGIAVVSVLAIPAFLVAAYFLQNWWMEQLREIEQRTSTSALLMSSNISVQFKGERDTSGYMEHFFEFSHRGARDTTEEEVDTFSSDNNDNNSMHDGDKATIIIPAVDDEEEAFGDTKFQLDHLSTNTTPADDARTRRQYHFHS